MKTALLTTAALIGFAGMAAAQCSGYHSTTAQMADAKMTPIPMADASEATETTSPLLLLQQAASDEG